MGDLVMSLKSEFFFSPRQSNPSLIPRLLYRNILPLTVLLIIGAIFISYFFGNTISMQ